MVSFKSWRPSSRRDRRRQPRRRTSSSGESDRTFLVIAGLFAAVLVGLLVMVALTSG